MSAVPPLMTSLRNHPHLKSIFKAAEARHLTDQELAEYCRIVPEYRDRAEAAREIREIEEVTIRDVVDEIFAIYPFEQYHEMAAIKAPRDMRYVSAYATLAMLMGDPKWFDDKLLIWLRTILQAFEFPDRKPTVRRALFARQNADNRLEKLLPKQRAIYETYTKIKQRYKERLSLKSYTLIESYLSQAIDTLTLDC